MLALAAMPACHSSTANINTQSGSGGGGAGSGAGGAGSGGSSASGTGGAGAGGGGCSIYQALCGGACVAVTDNPQNCGSCGHACAGTEVCAGGMCVAGGTGACPPGGGLTVCGGRCVDTSTDNANCGSCGHACTGMQGCADGGCVNAQVFPPPATCAGGGPAITVGTGSTAMCTGLTAQTTFTWGVCSCKDVAFDAEMLIDGWDSTKGPYVPMQLGGGVGADGSITAMSGGDIWGQSWAASASTSFNVSGLNVHHNVQSGGNITGEMSITKDAYVVGNVDDGVTIGGTLFQPKGKSHPSGVHLMEQPVTVLPPCNCGNPILVGDLVAWAKTNNNDAAINLDPGIMTQAGHAARIDLPCGVYYITGFNSNGNVVAHGNVALFVDGDISSSGGLTITVADASSALDLYVSGTIVTGANFKLGNAAYPAVTRLYIGTTGTLDIQSGLIIGAEIWAGKATVLWESDSDVFGSLFVGNFQVLSRLNLHQDEAVVRAGQGCPPPGGNGGGGVGGGTGGSGGGGCGTCYDCGNQACVNGTCGKCTTDAQCCSPLACINGSCVPIVP
jgi:hypothetical protein